MIFNKKCTEERFYQVLNVLKSFDWYPVFNNAFELKEKHIEWFEVNIPNIFRIDNKTAWSKIPNEMLEYIKNIPEFNEKIFNKIIGDIKDD